MHGKLHIQLATKETHPSGRQYSLRCNLHRVLKKLNPRQNWWRKLFQLTKYMYLNLCQ